MSADGEARAWWYPWTEPTKALWRSVGNRVYWRFEEGEGDVVRDMSDNGNDGRLNRGPQWVNSDLGGAWPRTRPLAHAGFTQDALRCAQGGRTPCT